MMVAEIWLGLFIAISFLIGWVGGSHTSMRQTRFMAESYHELTAGNLELRDENSKLKNEIAELRALVYSLQSQLMIYEKRVDQLSAQVAVERRENKITHS